MSEIAIIGAGAAGIFAAITAAEMNPAAHIIVWERTAQPLAKVRISGGGRCNVTHACFDPALLIQNYPRGNKALRGPFSRFQPQDTMQWFEQRGVRLKIEEDGRVFPVSDNSQTIIDCLLGEAKRLGVELRLIQRIEAIQKDLDKFSLDLATGEKVLCDKLLLACGSSTLGHELAKNFGHNIVAPVPSLFTFNVPSSPLLDLAGITVPVVELQLSEASYTTKGPLLLTHWGFSGPAALKLSAWAARVLQACNYKTDLFVNWLPEYSASELVELLIAFKTTKPSASLAGWSSPPLPKNLWKELIKRVLGPSTELPSSRLSHQELRKVGALLQRDSYKIEGKTTHKQEFVTCGGVDLDQINFQTMESRCCPNLFFAGEVLDIDGVTGGFNFQNAWTTGWLAGKALGK
jgi:predicted Rossmann fold flavoprotein